MRPSADCAEAVAASQRTGQRLAEAGQRGHQLLQVCFGRAKDLEASTDVTFVGTRLQGSEFADNVHLFEMPRSSSERVRLLLDGDDVGVR